MSQLFHCRKLHFNPIKKPDLSKFEVNTSLDLVSAKIWPNFDNYDTIIVELDQSNTILRLMSTWIIDKVIEGD